MGIAQRSAFPRACLGLRQRFFDSLLQEIDLISKLALRTRGQSSALVFLILTVIGLRDCAPAGRLNPRRVGLREIDPVLRSCRSSGPEEATFR